ncbi:MAG TPA: hypothetical protein VLH19_05850 [Patescibacteria group bacterium]|nr:hypothetical protein [Patescibacteria group bacterium]
MKNLARKLVVVNAFLVAALFVMVVSLMNIKPAMTSQATQVAISERHCSGIFGHAIWTPEGVRCVGLKNK